MSGWCSLNLLFGWRLGRDSMVWCRPLHCVWIDLWVGKFGEIFEMLTWCRQYTQHPLHTLMSTPNTSSCAFFNFKMFFQAWSFIFETARPFHFAKGTPIGKYKCLGETFEGAPREQCKRDQPLWRQFLSRPGFCLNRFCYIEEIFVAVISEIQT